MSDPAGNQAISQTELIEVIGKLWRALDYILLRYGHRMSKKDCRTGKKRCAEARKAYETARGYRDAD